MPPFLRLSDISKRFGGVRALTNVSLELQHGEVHCLAGENGSGKSTLIKIVSGIQAPENGASIEVEGRSYGRLTASQSTALGIQVIYQDLSLFPNLTVAENIAMARHGGRPHVVDWSAIRRTASEAMARLGVSLDLDARIEHLPIASRQLVAICRALAQEAKLIIMDEPTASLTRHEVKALLAMILELKRKGLVVVFVSHKLSEVLEVSDRVTVLRNGACVGTFEAREMDDKRLAHLMTGKEFTYQLSRVDRSKAEAVLSVSQLTRAGEYSDVSFSVEAGEILGITGVLGSGRTELALSLFGMNRPDAGEIHVAGAPVRFSSNRDAIRHGIAYVSEDRLTLGLVLEQPISSNILVTILSTIVGRFGLFDPGRRKAAVDRWIRDLAIKVSNPDNPVSTLSGGNQQRVVLAKWLACGPKLLILDSPTVGVDINAKDGIYAVVKALAATGVAVIMISDEIPEVLYHSHRILVMKQGRVTHQFESFATSETELEATVGA